MNSASVRIPTDIQIKEIYMGAFSRLRYVIAANVNSLLEKAEDPEKLLRALIREMEDASEEARIACAELLAEQQRLARLEAELASETGQWQSRAEKAVAESRDDLARAALKAKAELDHRHTVTLDEQKRVGERVKQMEADMATLKIKLADAKTKLKGLNAGKAPARVAAEQAEQLTPGERKIRRAMGRFDRLQTQVDNLEARVRSYEVGGTVVSTWSETTADTRDPAIEEELEQLKKHVAQTSSEDASQEASTES
jgi:phage shock protein A